MEQKRSRGVAIAGWILIAFAAVKLSDVVIEIGGAVFYPHDFTLENIPGTFFKAIFGVFHLFVGLEILYLKSWARKAVLFLSTLGLVMGIFLIVSFARISLEWKIIGLLFSGSYLYYFTRPKIKEQFK